MQSKMALTDYRKSLLNISNSKPLTKIERLVGYPQVETERNKALNFLIERKNLVAHAWKTQSERKVIVTKLFKLPK
jgi:hypothetical protein